MSFEPNPPIVKTEEVGWETIVVYGDGTSDRLPTILAEGSAPAPGVLRIAYRNEVVRQARIRGSSYRFPWEVPG